MTKFVKGVVTAALVLAAVSCETYFTTADAATTYTYGIGLQAGTLGLGPDFNVGFNKHFGIDLGLNAYNYKHSMTQSGINYGFKIKLDTVHLLANWYPFGGVFHLTAGLVDNGNKITGDATPTSGTFTINGDTYQASQVGTLNGQIKFPSIGYYLGVGWGLSYTPRSPWGFNFGIGALYQGKPKVSLSNSGSNLSGAAYTKLQQDIAAQQAKTQSDVNGFRWWPVARIGVYYKF